MCAPAPDLVVESHRTRVVHSHGNIFGQGIANAIALEKAIAALIHAVFAVKGCSCGTITGKPADLVGAGYPCWARFCRCRTFVNILAAACVGLKTFLAGAVERPGAVGTGGVFTTGGHNIDTFVDILTGFAVDQIALRAITTVRALFVEALQITSAGHGARIAFVNVFAAAAVVLKAVLAGAGEGTVAVVAGTVGTAGGHDIFTFVNVFTPCIRDSIAVCTGANITRDFVDADLRANAWGGVRIAFVDIFADLTLTDVPFGAIASPNTFFKFLTARTRSAGVALGLGITGDASGSALAITHDFIALAAHRGARGGLAASGEEGCRDGEKSQ